SALTVNIAIAGTATSGSDYTSLGTTVDFAPGSATAIKTVTVNDDPLVELDETVILTLDSGIGYVGEGPATATITLRDDDNPPLVIDDSAATYVGSWTLATTVPGYYGSGYQHDGNVSKGSKSATFRPNLATAGNYNVYIRYPARADRANNVPVDVVHEGATSTVTVNQQILGGQWNLLGTYRFAAGS